MASLPPSFSIRAAQCPPAWPWPPRSVRPIRPVPAATEARVLHWEVNDRIPPPPFATLPLPPMAWSLGVRREGLRRRPGPSELVDFDPGLASFPAEILMDWPPGADTLLLHARWLDARLVLFVLTSPAKRGRHPPLAPQRAETPREEVNVAAGRALPRSPPAPDVV